MERQFHGFLLHQKVNILRSTTNGLFCISEINPTSGSEDWSLQYMMDPDTHPVRRGGSAILLWSTTRYISGSKMKILLKRPVLLLSWPAGQQLHFLQEQGLQFQVKVKVKVKVKIKVNDNSRLRVRSRSRSRSRLQTRFRQWRPYHHGENQGQGATLQANQGCKVNISVADPDPGSGDFLTPESGIWDG